MNEVNEKLTKPYNPAETEARIYDLWDKSGFFNPDNLPESHTEPFTIIMPPFNANGHLHAGHFLMLAIQDLIIRYKRMRGFKTLWVPGADHAGFETQIVYEKKLEKEGRTRFDLTPDELYKEILAFTLVNKKHMEVQMKNAGASCDWTREKFTLDENVITETQKTFKKMFDDGLVYRGKRIVNWCAKHQTSLSDVETEFKEQADKFYYFKYGPFTIGTSRPETKFGDKYVVMHPDDTRYAQYKHGDKIDLEWINGPITATIIKDEAVDMEFGTGVMTITPWHDAVDFEIAERHNLDKEPIIDLKGKLLPIAEEFAGLHISKARPLIVEKLEKKGLLEKVDEKYVHNVKVCYKCENPIEPQIKDQWFVKMRPLADLAIKAVEEKKISFIPDSQEKVFMYWMNNTLDWNISRQIVWGIPIPAKICDKCDSGLPDLENTIATCPTCGGELRQDTDTFDTWFSSGQWPYLALNYPDSSDIKNFYPTSVMETGRDLVFKWVPRMVFMSLYRLGVVPFDTVYFHGLINDKHGKKMSKSKGNVVDPQELSDKFGTDALRMGLVVANAPGNDLALSEDKIKAYKHFANKIWNASRFVLEQTADFDESTKPEITATDLQYLNQLEATTKEITDDLDNLRLHLASEKIYHYFWHTFADIVIEDCKNKIKTGTPAEKISAQYTILQILKTSLILLHPFMPFVTEEIWGMINKDTGNLLMIEKWPVTL